MSQPLFALQAAIVTRLRADAALTALIGGARIFESVPPATSAPWVTFGEMNSRENGTSSDIGSEHRMAIVCVSQQPGTIEALAIAEHIETLLTNATLTLAGHRLVNLIVTGIELRRGAKDLTRNAVLRLRAVTEQL